MQSTLYARTLALFVSVAALGACATSETDDTSDLFSRPDESEQDAAPAQPLPDYGSSPDASMPSPTGHDAGSGTGDTKDATAADSATTSDDAAMAPPPPPFDAGTTTSGNDCDENGPNATVYEDEAVVAIFDITAAECPPDCGSGQCCYASIGLCIAQ